MADIRDSVLMDDKSVVTLSRAILVSALRDWRNVKKYRLDSSSPVYRSVVNFFNSSFCEDILLLLFPDYEPDYILWYIRELNFPSGKLCAGIFDGDHLPSSLSYFNLSN
ncbi:MAG: hypothetical protein Q4F31_09435 [Eubacteriales bacterium]|nr:hypothetical protein [Eubacteriales bacterium]